MTDVNKQEIRRWLDDPDEPLIWERKKGSITKSWHKQSFADCNWFNDCIYIVDDKQAKLRKLQFDGPEYNYPIFKVANKGTDREFIVKFTNLIEGKVVFVMPDTHYTIGYKSKTWVEHTNTETWQDVLYDKEKGLYDKQAVLCCDYSRLVRRVIKFYDAKNKCTFNVDGTRNDYHYNNYAPYPHPDDDFIIEMYRNLEN